MSSMSTSDEVGDVQQAHLAGQPHVLLHRQAEGGDLAAERDGGVGDLLHAVDVAGEAGDDDAAALVLVEEVVEHRADALLAAGVAVAVGVGGVAQQQADALVVGDAPRCGPRSVSRPSTGVRSSFQSPVCMITPCGVWNAVAKPCGTEWVTGMNSTSNGPILRRSPSTTGISSVLVEQPRLLDAVPGQAERERRAVDRERQLAQQEARGRRRGPRGRGWRCSRSTRSAFSRSQVKSGRTRSMPSCRARGTSARSRAAGAGRPPRCTMQLRPISPRPPRNVMRTGSGLAPRSWPSAGPLGPRSLSRPSGRSLIARRTYRLRSRPGNLPRDRWPEPPEPRQESVTGARGPPGPGGSRRAPRR